MIKEDGKPTTLLDKEKVTPKEELELEQMRNSLKELIKPSITKKNGLT